MYLCVCVCVSVAVEHENLRGGGSSACAVQNTKPPNQHNTRHSFTSVFSEVNAMHMFITPRLIQNYINMCKCVCV